MKLRSIVVSFFLAIMMMTMPVVAGEHMVDINSATVVQLQEVKGIGEKTAMAIVAYRDEHGAYKDVDALLHVKGIGEKKLGTIKPYLKAGKKNSTHK